MKEIVSGVLSMLVVACSTQSGGDRNWVRWPEFGDYAEAAVLRGFTNEVPDIVGPVDGSATLTIFAEGHNFPILLPMVADELSAWSSYHCQERLVLDDVLFVTLPPFMILEALEHERIRLGNAVIPLSLNRVYPDVVIGAAAPLRTLAREGKVKDNAVAFARHVGMGLLLRREHAAAVPALAELPDTDLSVILATPEEASERKQSLDTLVHILGRNASDAILEREVQHFFGRVNIQHRDVPFALLSGHADVGLIYSHLATFYADSFPDELVALRIPETEHLGRRMLLAQTSENPSDAAECFEKFILANAGSQYPAAGFASLASFKFGERISLVSDQEH